MSDTAFILKSFEVNGLEIVARFRKRDVEDIFLPLLFRLSALQTEKGGRVMCFLAAPPAAGKSTLARLLEALSRETPGLKSLQTLGIDGFHYPNAYLRNHFIERGSERLALSAVKGAPESYDVRALAQTLRALAARPALCCPVYDRRLHEPVPDGVRIDAPVVLVEGNWLLLDEAPWRELRGDYSVFLRAGEPRQLERVVARKRMGGIDEETARRFAEENDAPNILRCMAHARSADLTLAPDGDDGWKIVRPGSQDFI